MTTNIRPVGNLTEQDVRDVLTAATAAPSLHNSQPWLFRCTPSVIELYADPTRDLSVADPDRREMLLACGAALFNLRLALRARGLHPTVSLVPDRTRPDLLATIRPVGHRPVAPADLTLAEAITRRHTNRRPFAPTPVPAGAVSALRSAARAEQVWLATLAPARLPLLRGLVATAHQAQQQDPRFVAEWREWTAREAGASDGVPRRNSGPLPEPQDEWVLRDFSGGQAKQRVPGKDFEPDPLIVVLGSFHDQPLARLQTGQAMQRVLLTATVAGLSASFLSQVVEVPDTRRQLRELIGGGLWPQTVLRIGYGMPVPPTPRRDLCDVVAGDRAGTQVN
ncbi:MAG TPA: nitroreductase family protein [Mycobacteriales bacterium]|nr:nitroreductase family protein [Mycobacteriales bacterium]